MTFRLRLAIERTRNIPGDEPSGEATISSAALAYFEGLFRTGLTVAATLPLKREFASMAYVTVAIKPAVEKGGAAALFAPPSAEVLAAVNRNPDRSRPAGLNTVGLLLDRLSILTMKHWSLEHRRDEPQAAKELKERQISDVIAALATANPGSSSINTKVTSHNVAITDVDLSSAMYGLFTSNFLLWEAQEVLYNRDIDRLECEEIRSYISFFSSENLRRNHYIQACDEQWWSLVMVDT